jgi:uncharacterized protein (DUF885 family)
MQRRLVAAALVALAACSGGPRPRPTGEALAREYDRVAARAYDKLLEHEPHIAVRLGVHRYDGRLPDRTPAGLGRERAELEHARAELEAIPAAELPRARRLEREVLLVEIRDRLFRLVELDEAHRNPMSTADALELAPYVLRDYAPLDQRAAAIVRVCEAAPAYLAQARANLVPVVPRAWVDTAILMFRGQVEFINQELRPLLLHVDTPLASQAQIEDALDECVAALSEHARWLEGLRLEAGDDYRLGEARLLRMLAETQGVDIDLATLARIAEEDLARNTAAIEAAAREIDPEKSVREVVAAVGEERPAPDQVLTVAAEQTRAARQFVVDHGIATIPLDDPVEVRETPAFARWNIAALDEAGPFEEKALGSFYDVSPPDPSWPAEEQRAYIPATTDLFMITMHEVWPGHFLHGLHMKQHPSRIVRSFCTITYVEGWAHYVEEMMVEAGAGGGTPQQRIAQRKAALLRDVRFLAAIGLHARGMSVVEATKLFEDRAFLDPANARQQAMRGTFDPMYLSYTLGKLMILKLREDWRARQGAGFSLRAFHDTFLGYGCAPIPVVRRDMLGDDSGRIL